MSVDFRKLWRWMLLIVLIVCVAMCVALSTSLYNLDGAIDLNDFSYQPLVGLSTTFHSSVVIPSINESNTQIGLYPQFPSIETVKTYTERQNISIPKDAAVSFKYFLLNGSTVTINWSLDRAISVFIFPDQPSYVDWQTTFSDRAYDYTATADRGNYTYVVTKQIWQMVYVVWVSYDGNALGTTFVDVVQRDYNRTAVLFCTMFPCTFNFTYRSAQVVIAQGLDGGGATRHIAYRFNGRTVPMVPIVVVLLSLLLAAIVLTVVSIRRQLNDDKLRSETLSSDEHDVTSQCSGPPLYLEAQSRKRDRSGTGEYSGPPS